MHKIELTTEFELGQKVYVVYEVNTYDRCSECGSIKYDSKIKCKESTIEEYVITEISIFLTEGAKEAEVSYYTDEGSEIKDFETLFHSRKEAEAFLRD